MNMHEKILDNLQELVYIADMETYELLYYNRALAEKFHIPQGLRGKCHEILQGRQTPCPFCTNSRLSKEGCYVWKFYNRLVKRHFMLSDSICEFNGRQVRTEVAMDIMAKHVAPDEDGVRIAELDEMSYRRQLWEHRPLTDFWRVGRGYAKKLEAIGIYTMGDIAKCSIGRPNEYCNEELLYQMFGINAELLIDHAWGWEPTTIEAIKAYRPSTNSISSGQVLQCPYPYDKARLVVREMAEAVAMDLLEKRLVTDQLTLTVGYDIENTAGGNFRGEIVTDRYGRKIPKHTHGTMNLPRKTSSARSIMDAVLGIYDEKVNPKLSVRRITITANKIVSEDDVPQKDEVPVQFNLFDDIAAQEQQRKNEENRLERERKIQEAMLGIKKKFGKNAILNGGSYLDGATARERNGQIGGHKA